MNVYVLKRDCDWEEECEKAIVAGSDQRAREIANMNCGDEGEVWMDSSLVTCRIVDLETEGEILSECS